MTTPPRTLEEIAKELARSEHWPDRKGEFALCGPCTERSDRKLSPEQRAGDIVDAWEHFEGETMRDGHRATLERLIASQIREAVEAAVRQEREALRAEIIRLWDGAVYDDALELAETARRYSPLVAWIDARSRAEKPKV